MTRLARVLRILRTTRWSWRRPRRGGVLVFDSYASAAITQVLAPGTYDVFDNHFEVINVPIALRTIIGGGRSWYDYCRNFVTAVRPRLLVSAIDSNAHLYTFKHVSPSTQVVVLQNGIRGRVSPSPDGDLWATLARDFTNVTPTADLILTLGDAHSPLYERHIRCSTRAIGSSKNNSIVRPNSLFDGEQRRVAFVSQYSGLDHEDIFPDGGAPRLLTHVGHRGIDAAVFHAVDGRAARATARWCKKMDYEFVIIGRRPQSFVHERKFFEQWCGDANFSFVPKGGEAESYEIALRSDLVVSVDSTLGYEMLARGKRVAFVSARGTHVERQAGSGVDLHVFRFGYPDELEPEGLFWTSSDEDDDVQRVTELAMNCDTRTWERTVSPVVPRVMAFDPGNARLRRALAERGAVLAH